MLILIFHRLSLEHSDQLMVLFTLMSLYLCAVFRLTLLVRFVPRDPLLNVKSGVTVFAYSSTIYLDFQMSTCFELLSAQLIFGTLKCSKIATKVFENLGSKYLLSSNCNIPLYSLFRLFMNLFQSTFSALQNLSNLLLSNCNAASTWALQSCYCERVANPLQIDIIIIIMKRKDVLEFNTYDLKFAPARKNHNSDKQYIRRLFLKNRFKVREGVHQQDKNDKEDTYQLTQEISSFYKPSLPTVRFNFGNQIESERVKTQAAKKTSVEREKMIMRIRNQLNGNRYKISVSERSGIQRNLFKEQDKLNTVLLNTQIVNSDSFSNKFSSHERLDKENSKRKLTFLKQHIRKKKKITEHISQRDISQSRLLPEISKMRYDEQWIKKEKKQKAFENRKRLKLKSEIPHFVRNTSKKQEQEEQNIIEGWQQ